MKEINRKIAVGAIWMVLFKFLERGLGLISTIVLARLLVPADFGLIAMAMSIVAMLELLTAFGFETAIIQNNNATRVHYDTAWTLNVLFGVGSSIVLIALAKPAAVFYQDARLEIVIYCLAAGSFVHGLQNIGVVNFRKDMEFNKEFRFQLAKKLIGFCVTVPLAFNFGNYWALVAGMVSGRVGYVMLSYVLHPYRPRLSLAGRHDLFNFSKWLLFNNFLYFLKLRSTDFIIGKLSGPRALGLYNIGYEIANLPTTEMVAPINRAVFPGYAKMSHNLEILRQGYLNVISMIALFAIPAGAGIAVTAELLVPVVLGDKWLDAIPLIQILTWYGVLIAMQSNISSVYLALGKPKILSYLGVLALSVQLPMVIYFTRESGTLGAAWAYLWAGLLVLPVNYIVMFTTIKLKTRRFFSVIWRPIIGTIVMFHLVERYMDYTRLSSDLAGQIIKLTSSVLIGAIVYLIVVMLLWLLALKPVGAEQFFVDKLLSKLSFKGRLKSVE